MRRCVRQSLPRNCPFFCSTIFAASAVLMQTRAAICGAAAGARGEPGRSGAGRGSGRASRGGAEQARGQWASLPGRGGAGQGAAGKPPGEERSGLGQRESLPGRSGAAGAVGEPPGGGAERAGAAGEPPREDRSGAGQRASLPSRLPRRRHRCSGTRPIARPNETNVSRFVSLHVTHLPG